MESLASPHRDEPHHPRLGKYQHQHTKDWSATVSRADAFVFVTPEYNYGPAPSLVNAITYLNAEWRYKPAGFVSYGSAGAGISRFSAPVPAVCSGARGAAAGLM